MKALFCHDHYYYRGNDGVMLSKGQYHYGLWTRYLNHFDNVTVVGRNGGKADDHAGGTNIVSGDNVAFSLFPNRNSLMGMVQGRSDIRGKVSDLVAAHDVIILRGTSELGLMAYKEAKRQGKFIAMEVVSDAWDELWYHGSILAKLYAPYRFIKQKQLARHAHAVMYVSRQFLQRRYPTLAPLTGIASNVDLPDSEFYKRDDVSNPKGFKIGLIGTLKNKLKGFL